MKKNFTKVNFKFIASQVLLLGLILVLQNNKVSAQCIHLTTENGIENKLNIPCDFPVFINNNQPEQDKLNFESELKNWFINNPKFKDLQIAPASHLTNYSVEIPFSVYSSFTLDKKKMIDAIPYFYKVVKKG